ncbi:MAG: toprim domain-containing protein [Paludibacter sp.]|jgi:hypothetical protein|nr:toprim domain-containing protein [Paludibacter sp.]
MQTKDIKSISIKDYLRNHGINPSKEYSGYGMYKSPFRDEHHPSFKVDYKANLWYDFGSGEGGSIIDLVMKMQDCTLSQAMHILEEKADFPPIVKTAFSSPSESVGRMKLIRVEQFLSPHLESYLRERGISRELSAEYLTAVYYRVNDREYSALGFRNDEGGFELRNSQFQGCYPPKAITTLDRNTTVCNLFEGFMDFLSYLTLYPMKEKSLPSGSTVVLNGTGNLKRAIPFLSKHTEIYAYLDNDKSGKEAVQKLQNLKLPVTDCFNMYADHNDLNDFLKQMIRQKPAQIIPKNRRMKR